MSRYNMFIPGREASYKANCFSEAGWPASSWGLPVFALDPGVANIHDYIWILFGWQAFKLRSSYLCTVPSELPPSQHCTSLLVAPAFISMA